MKVTCKCLNFIVEVDSYLDLETLQLDLTSLEKAHPYFTKDVYRMTGKINIKAENYSNLIKTEIVGSWNIRQCLVCRMYIHATNYVNGLSTCSSLLQETTDLKIVGRDEAMSFSQVFQICFPSRLDVPEDFSSPVPGSEILDYRDIERIDKQAKSFLEMAENKMKGNSKTITEPQQQGLEALRRRVFSEKSYLIQLLIKSKEEILNDNPLVETSNCKSLLERRYSAVMNTKDESRIANIKPYQNQFESEFGKLKINPVKKESLSGEDSDTEDIFEMDDFDSFPCDTVDQPPPFDLDEENSDGDEAASLSFHREYKPPPRDIARSAPLNVPVWPLALPRQTKQEEEYRPTNPKEIAASMKEMAKNMRVSSVDVFGDLPRPQLPKDAARYYVP